MLRRVAQAVSLISMTHSNNRVPPFALGRVGDDAAVSYSSHRIFPGSLRYQSLYPILRCGLPSLSNHAIAALPSTTLKTNSY